VFLPLTVSPHTNTESSGHVPSQIIRWYSVQSAHQKTHRHEA